MTIEIHPRYWTVRYNGAVFPGSGHDGLDGGANCQVFAYALLADHGLHLPPFRSSDLWDDVVHTQVVEEWAPLDLVLLHSKPEAYGAHVSLYVGDGQVLHLAKHHGVPRVEPLQEMLALPRYRFLIGGKRVVAPALRSHPRAQ